MSRRDSLDIFVCYFVRYLSCHPPTLLCKIHIGGSPKMASSENKGTILYIEDNPDNRLLVKRILLSEDYALLEAKNAFEALDVLKSARPDLILMDINMPDMDGYTLTAKIKTMPEFEQTPILALTANVMRGDKEKTLEAGCDGYIQKPIDIDHLTREIERFMMRRTNA
jgi:two-component system cell cycle response regulator DivK